MSRARTRFCVVLGAVITISVVGLHSASLPYVAFGTGPLFSSRLGFYWSIKSGLVRAAVTRGPLRVPASYYGRISRFEDLEFWLLESSANTAAMRGLNLSFPLWTVPVLTAAPTVTLFLVSIRRRRVGACRSCGYDLRGTPTGVCPECGMEWSCRE
jgi:hypothetical protein